MNFNLNEDAFRVAIAGLCENSFATNEASDKETYVTGVLRGDCSFTQSKPIDGKRMSLLSCDVLI